MNNKAGSKAGFTLVEIIIVVGIIGMLAAISIPNLIRARTRSQMSVCLDNLRQIDSAKQQWAAEFRKESTAIPQPADLAPFLNRAGHADAIVCPSASAGATFTTSYTLNNITNRPSCNILPSGPGAHALPD